MNERDAEIVLLMALATAYLERVASSRWEYVNPIYSHGKEYVKITIERDIWEEIKRVAEKLKEV